MTKKSTLKLNRKMTGPKIDPNNESNYLNNKKIER